MTIKTLSLVNFRNFAEVDEIVFPEQPLLVAAAPNATGKTNFLESIVLLLRGKSFRAQAEECVRWGEEGFLLRGQIERGDGSSHIFVRYHKPSKKLRIEENGSPASLITFYANYPLVLFLPEDVFLFFRGPAQRRNFLNHILVSSPHYLSALVQYQRVLRQRNAALKTAGEPADIRTWTELLAEHAVEIWRQRQMAVQFLNTHISSHYEQLTGETLPLDITLSMGAAQPDQLPDLLEEAWSYEKKYQYTVYGPHRDDMTATVDERPVRAALSQGQMRGLIISLKLSAHLFLKKVTGEEPLLLFDEALSELDDERQARLLEQLPSAQTLLTCTAVPTALRRRADVHLLDLRSIITSEQPAAVDRQPAAVPA